jgi:streptogramin lyase
MGCKAVRPLAAVLISLAMFTVHAPSAGAAEGDITTFPDGSGNTNQPNGIAADADGNLWFTNVANTRIGRMTPDGTFTSFANASVVGAREIVAGPDGNMWLAVANTNQIGKITPAGVITLYPDGNVSSPSGITVGPDGNLWFTSTNNDRIGKITSAGVITTYPDAAIDDPVDIAAGADGNLWFTNSGDNRIGRITTSGTVTTFPDPGLSISFPEGIAAGSDGNMWFTSVDNDRIGLITPDGQILTFSDPQNEVDAPRNLVSGADGNIWFTSGNNNRVGRIQLATADITTFTAANVDAPLGITAGPDGDVWFTSFTSNRIGHAVVCSEPRFSDVPTSNPFLFDICWMDGQAISTGFPGNQYRPSEPVTRQAMAAFMYRLAGEPPFIPPPDTASFSDVPIGSTFYAEVEWLVSEGITTGFPGGTYRPGEPVTRQAMSAFMYRLAGSPSFTDPVTPTFSDVPIGSTFFHQIEWMADQGITTGFPGGTFRPGEAVTRQAMSAFLHRLATGVGVGDGIGV